MKQNIIIPNILFLVGATSCSKEETTLNEPKITESTNLEGQNIK
jgi:hypothetical protein